MTTTRSAKATAPAVAWTPDHAAQYVGEAWRNAVTSIIETGRRLAEAKKHVGHGNWLPTIERLPFGRRTAQTLMTIAAHPDLGNGQHAAHLPASWSTLAVLAELPPGEIPQRIEAGEITPDLDRATAQRWAAARVQARQEMFGVYSSAADALARALSGAQAYTPPGYPLPASYLPVAKFIERAEQLAAIAREWTRPVTRTEGGDEP